MCLPFGVFGVAILFGPSSGGQKALLRQGVLRQWSLNGRGPPRRSLIPWELCGALWSLIPLSAAGISTIISRESHLATAALLNVVVKLPLPIFGCGRGRSRVPLARPIALRGDMND